MFLSTVAHIFPLFAHSTTAQSSLHINKNSLSFVEMLEAKFAPIFTAAAITIHFVFYFQLCVCSSVGAIVGMLDFLDSLRS